MFFLILLEYQYYNTPICYSLGSTQRWNCPTNDFIERKDFYWMKIKYFYIALHWAPQKILSPFLRFLLIILTNQPICLTLGWIVWNEISILFSMYYDSMQRIKEYGNKGKVKKWMKFSIHGIKGIFFLSFFDTWKIENNCKVFSPPL